MDAANRRIESIIFSNYQYEMLNYFQWAWHCRVKMLLCSILAVFFCIFAVAIIVAELTSFISEIIFINPFIHITKI